MVSFEDFAKLEIRIAKVIGIEAVENSNKLYKLTVDIGNEQRTLVAGIREFYTPEELHGKLIAMICNLDPKTIKGITSQGMLLAADDNGKVALLTVNGEISPGAKIR